MGPRSSKGAQGVDDKIPNDARNQQKALRWYYNPVFRSLKDQRRRAVDIKKQDSGYPEQESVVHVGSSSNGGWFVTDRRPEPPTWLVVAGVS